MLNEGAWAYAISPFGIAMWVLISNGRVSLGGCMSVSSFDHVLPAG